jgi:hypothetical protein
MVLGLASSAGIVYAGISFSMAASTESTRKTTSTKSFAALASSNKEWQQHIDSMGTAGLSLPMPAIRNDSMPETPYVYYMRLLMSN